MRRRHVIRRRQTVATAIPLWHGSAVRRRTDQLVGSGRGLRGAGTVCGRGLHRRRRAAYLRRHVLLAAVSRQTTAQRPRLARHASDRRPNPRDLDAGRGDDATEAAGLRHGGGRAANVRRRHQAEPGAAAAVGQRAGRRHHPGPARRAARAGAGARAPRAAGACADPQDAAAALPAPARHQMKALRRRLTLIRLLFHVMRLVNRLSTSPSTSRRRCGIINVRTYPRMERTFLCI